MLISELQGKTTNFNSQLASSSFPKVDAGGVDDEISGLKNAWTTTSGVEVIPSLEKQLNNLENDLKSLEEATKQIEDSYVSFEFSKERL